MSRFTWTSIPWTWPEVQRLGIVVPGSKKFLDSPLQVLNAHKDSATDAFARYLGTWVLGYLETCFRLRRTRGINAPPITNHEAQFLFRVHRFVAFRSDRSVGGIRV